MLQKKNFLTVSQCPENKAYFPSPMCFLSGSVVKNPPEMQELQETWVQSVSWEDLLEKGMAGHSSILAWRIPRTEKPGGLQSIRSQKVGHNWTWLKWLSIRAHTPPQYARLVLVQMSSTQRSLSYPSIYKNPGNLFIRFPYFPHKHFLLSEADLSFPLKRTLHHNLCFDAYHIPSYQHVTFIESIIN